MNGLRRAEAGITALEEYALGSASLNRVHPGAKMLAAAAYIICVVSLPAVNLSALIPFTLYPAALAPLSNVPFRALARRLLPVLPFAFLGGIANLVVMREPLFMLGNLIITKGLTSFAVIMLKAMLCASSALLLIGSTPFHTICAELRRLHIPALVCVQLALMYRYIAVLLNEAAAMQRAYTLRSSETSIKMKDMGSFLGRLLLRSVDKAGRVYNAMKCRGWNGDFFVPPRGMRITDWAYCLSICSCCVFFRFFNLPKFLGGLFYA